MRVALVVWTGRRRRSFVLGWTGRLEHTKFGRDARHLILPIGVYRFNRTQGSQIKAYARVIRDRQIGDQDMTTPTSTPPASRTLCITGSTIAWSAWILFGVAFELWALLSGHVKSTLSWKWWSVFRVRQKVPLWVRIALLIPQLVFLLWLPFHLPFGLLS